mgnify:CR=1 FL=1
MSCHHPQELMMFRCGLWLVCLCTVRARLLSSIRYRRRQYLWCIQALVFFKLMRVDYHGILKLNTFFICILMLQSTLWWHWKIIQNSQSCKGVWVAIIMSDNTITDPLPYQCLSIRFEGSYRVPAFLQMQSTLNPLETIFRIILFSSWSNWFWHISRTLHLRHK